MKILLAEDEKNLGTILKQSLQDDGYIVDLVTDGVEAVSSFMDNTYDFVLLDIKMPRLDGNSALRLIKKINPNVPALTFSGNAGSKEMLDSIKAGAHTVLPKPFEISQLKEEIKKYTSSKW
jgi:DNA-binding response OmpR family regulator